MKHVQQMWEEEEFLTKSSDVSGIVFIIITCKAKHNVHNLKSANLVSVFQGGWWVGWWVGGVQRVTLISTCCKSAYCKVLQ